VVRPEELEVYNDQEKGGELTDKEVRRIKFQLLEPLGQGHNIVVHIQGSPGWTDRFRQLAGRIIPMDNRTRWNS
jgi:hypothetical protein